MIDKIFLYESDSADPYANLALEECLLTLPAAGTLIFFLWQNDKTVVIGRNQNCLRECDVTALTADGGRLARRMSGGGAVYHDKGNLNFTFITTRQDYEETAQTHIILTAVKSLGVYAESKGRNDLSVNGRKFSGNAYYHGANSLRHGTILVSTDLNKINKYLGVTGGKLETKGVKSVRANVVNLTELNPKINIQNMKTAFINAVQNVYGAPASVMTDAAIDGVLYDGQYKKHAGAGWIMGNAPESGYTLRERFAWGEVEICLSLKNGAVEKCAVFSDALDTELIGALPGVLTGCPFKRGAFVAAVCNAVAEDAPREDISGMFAAVPA